MSVPPKRVALVQEWMKKAANDLKNAEHTLTLLDPECPFDTVCFHAQQCVEKSLKAFLTYHGIHFEKTHELGQLLFLCSPDPDLVQELSGVKRLSFYAVEGRYPEGEGGESDQVEEEIDRAEAEGAVSLAQKAYEAVQRRLAPRSSVE